MGLFSDNITSELITETILRYACESYKKAGDKWNIIGYGVWTSWTSLYKSIINTRPFASDSVYSYYINQGRDRYYKETGHYYIYKFKLYSPNSLKESGVYTHFVEEFYFVESDPLEWDEYLESYVKR